MQINLTLFILFLAFMQVSANSYAQRITLNKKNIPLEKVFQYIEIQTDYIFLYNTNELKNTNIDINVENSSIKELMKECLKDLPFTFRITKNSILVKASVKNEIESLPEINLQQKELSGKVVNEKGEPLPKISVTLKGTSVGTVTHDNGSYTLSVPNKFGVLVFSAVGFISQEISIGDAQIVNITLLEDILELSETVVIGYGSVKKSDLTGSVSSVKMEDISKAPVASFTEALAGRIAGVRVSSPESQPGQLPEITIRGPGSATQSNAPLYVIDGFPTEDVDETMLNTEEIESINVLKDASATAIYGSRAANGVIIIETKKGKVGKPVVSYNTYFGHQPVAKKIEMMSPYEFVKYQTEIGYTSRYLADGITLDNYKDLKGINWQDEVFRNALAQDHNISIRGGSPQTKYSLSGSIHNKDGIIKNSGLTRAQGRLSLDQKVSKNLNIGITTSYNRFKNSGELTSAGEGDLGLRSNLFMRIWGYRPIIAAVDTLENGEVIDLLEAERDPLNPNSSVNPLISTQNITRTSTTSIFSTSMVLNYSINKNLTMRLRASINNNEKVNDRFQAAKAVSLVSTKGITGSINSSKSNSWSTENTLTWKTKIKNHNLNAMAGISANRNKYSIHGYSAINIPGDELGIFGIDEGTPSNISFSGNENSLGSFFARINYNYKSKYLFTTTFRGDGSSKFIAKNRWGYFPSAALAWNMKKEDFFKKSNLISESKIRVSYGMTGNNRVTSYAAYPEIGISNIYSFNNALPVPAAFIANLGNSDLKWESTSQMDVGYDLAMFKNRVAIVVDLYRKTTKDMLLNAQLPTSMGFSSATKNIGSMKNEGIELTLNTVNLSSSQFRWISNFNISFNKNTLLSLADGENNLFNIARFQSAWSMPLYRSQVGKPLGMFYGLVFDGVYQYEDFNKLGTDRYILKDEVTANGEARGAILPGNIKYKDINGDGLIDVNDRVNIGRGQPIHTGGFINDFAYHGFELSVFFQWSYGNDIYNANRVMLEGNESNVPHFNQYASYANRWSDDNQNTINFRTGGSGNAMHSSRVLEDGSYIRLKTLSLGYQIPKTIIKKVGVDLLRIGISIQNLLTWTNYSGLDPEVSVLRSVLTPGLDFSAYPASKTVVFSLNASF